MSAKFRLAGIYSLATALSLGCGVALAVAVPGQGTWESTLSGRDLDGNAATMEAYYDSSLNITWLADANYAFTTLADPDGRMTWADANAWAGALDINGVQGWRLPATFDAGNDGCASGNDCGQSIDSNTSEMAHMFYTTLGNLAYFDSKNVGPQPGWGLTNTGPFSNIQAEDYWSSTVYSPDPVASWHFSFENGEQYATVNTVHFFAWAVKDGDVAGGSTVVPLPATAWMLLSGLAGLVGIARRRQG